MKHTNRRNIPAIGNNAESMLALKNHKLLQIGAATLGVFTIGLGVFTPAYFFSQIYNTASAFTGACYVIGGIALIAAGTRLIWRSIPASTHLKTKH
jgi:hypothetical protein